MLEDILFVSMTQHDLLSSSVSTVICKHIRVTKYKALNDQVVYLKDFKLLHTIPIVHVAPTWLYDGLVPYKYKNSNGGVAENVLC